MNKRLLALLVAAVSSATPLMADEETVGRYTWTYSIEDDTAVIVNGANAAISPEPTGAVTVPATLGGYPVKSIGFGAFFGCRGLTSVTIPNSVTSIGPQAFWRCSGLTSVTIPNSVTSIGDSAFRGCSGLTSVTIPNSVTSIGDSAFRGCSGLAKDGFVIVGGILFDYGGPGGSVVIPTGVTRIDDYAFSGCSALTNVTIPVGVTSIGSDAFSGCSALTSVMIPNSVTNIGSSVFSGCTNLTSVTIPDGVKEINYSTFKDCRALASVTIPASVTSIGWSAFSGCSGLTSVTIPDGVTSIGDKAFYGCSGLTSVTIPNSVTSIGDSAFYGCSGLAKDDFVILGGILFDYVGLGGGVVIPAGVTSIGDSAFYNCRDLTSVTIPDSVTSIGASAFYNCRALTNVTIPTGVTSIGDSAFYGSGLTSVTIPVSVTSIGSSAFRGCGGLAEGDFVVVRNVLFDYVGPGGDVVIPDGVESVGERAFYGSGLTSVSIPTSVTAISSSAFKDCDGLRSVTIPQCACSSTMKKMFPAAYQSITNVVIADGVTKIGASAFAGCRGLPSVEIPGSVTEIGSSAFSGCSSLTGVTIPDGVKSIEDYTFKKCSGLTSVSIPASVTKISSSAFSKCDGLRSVTIPQCVCSSTMKKVFPDAYQSITNVVISDDVTSIGSGTFSGCKHLDFDTTTMPGVKLLDGWAVGNTGDLPEELDLTGVRGVGGKAFYNCKGLASVIIPASVTGIGEDAFHGCRSLTKIFFEGDAPNVAKSAFSSVRSGCTVYVQKDSSGWGVEIPGKWNKVHIAYIVEGVVDGGKLDPTFAKAQTVQGALIKYDKNDRLVGTVQVKVGRINAKKRTARLSAVATLIENGKTKKYTAKAVTVTVDASQYVPPTTLTFKASDNRILSNMMKFEMGADGVFTLASSAFAMARATVGGALKGGARGTFRLEEFDLAVPGTLQDDLLPSEESFDVAGGQWKFAQPATVKWTLNRETKEYGRVVDESSGKANRSGLKLSYAAKTGIFKGSFKAYSLQDAPGGKKKMKKLKVNVIGFVVDGVGTGEASCKRPAGGPWAVTIE